MTPIWNFALSEYSIFQKQYFCPNSTVHSVKGTVQRDFWPLVFSSFEPAWATDQWGKIFSILVKISLSYLNFYESPKGIILRRVNLPGVSNPYPGESFFEICVEISPGYLTAQSHAAWPGLVNSRFLKLLHRPLKGQCHKTDVFCNGR